MCFKARSDNFWALTIVALVLSAIGVEASAARLLRSRQFQGGVLRLIRSVVLSATMVAGLLVGAPTAAVAMESIDTAHVIASAISGEGKNSTNAVTDKQAKSRVVWLKTRRATFKEAPSAGADRRASKAAIGFKMTVVPVRGPWLQVDTNKYIHRNHVVFNERQLWGSPKFAQLYAWRLIPHFKGWGARGTKRHEDQYMCLKALWNHESGWNRHAMNRSSGAYGIPQSKPGRKMAKFGRDWQYNPKTQIKWGLSYIKGRYGSPCGAWGHFQSHNWY